MNANKFWQGVMLWVPLLLVLACGFFLILIMPTLGFDISDNFKHTLGAIMIIIVVFQCCISSIWATAKSCA